MPLFVRPPAAWYWLPPALAAALIWLASSAVDLPGWASAFVLVATAFLAAQSVLLLAERIAVMRRHLMLYDSPDALWYRGLVEARALAADVLRMNNEHLQAWVIAMYQSASRAGVESEELDGFIARFQASLEATRIQVQKDRAAELLRYAAENNGWLPAVRATSDGSADRRYLSDTIGKLVAAGAAQPAAGPNPARVLSYKKASEVLGL